MVIPFSDSSILLVLLARSSIAAVPAACPTACPEPPVSPVTLGAEWDDPPALGAVVLIAASVPLVDVDVVTSSLVVELVVIELPIAADAPSTILVDDLLLPFFLPMLTVGQFKIQLILQLGVDSTADFVQVTVGRRAAPL